MKAPFCMAALVFAAPMVQAQTLERAYNRDTNELFKLKSVATQSRVMGPVVRQSTVFTFENPYKKLTEASVWFSLDWAAVLSGFAYWYKEEYVPGVLMDKNKAWFIYTAITSRNEDPGIMVQTSPSSYHAQIFPIATGYDLRIELTSMGFLRPKAEGDELEVPSPSFQGEASFQTKAHSWQPETIRPVKDDKGRDTFAVSYPKSSPLDLQVYAQRHRDGWVYVAGLLRRDKPIDAIQLMGLQKVYWAKPKSGLESARWFIGRRKGPGAVSARLKDGSASSSHPIKANARGSDIAKLWAHQKLVQDDWQNRKSVLDFSLKYGIPSSQTALLAVPDEQMKLFRQKEAEWRRKMREEARRQRAWQKSRPQNWRSTQGGDPEIRVLLPGAVKAYAVLPDGRRFDLKPTGDGYWGGSYDIPANAAEGQFVIKVIGLRADASRFETQVSYEVDRTPPEGKTTVVDGFLVVRSEPKLARVIALLDDGTEVELEETEPGVYRLKLGSKLVRKVILYDDAHNRREIPLTR